MPDPMRTTTPAIFAGMLLLSVAACQSDLPLQASDAGSQSFGLAPRYIRPTA